MLPHTVVIQPSKKPSIFTVNDGRVTKKCRLDYQTFWSGFLVIIDLLTQFNGVLKTYTAFYIIVPDQNFPLVKFDWMIFTTTKQNLEQCAS